TGIEAFVWMYCCRKKVGLAIRASEPGNDRGLSRLQSERLAAAVAELESLIWSLGNVYHKQFTKFFLSF
ncbi:MAG: hypothetical protein ABIQ35_03915, partial [Verrucomicrobiota bacterium]